MTLSVTGAAGALAALQALSLQTQANSSAPTSASTSPASTPTPAKSSAPTTSQTLFAAVDGLGQALSAADAADASGQTVLDLLHQLRDTASQAADPKATQGQRAGLDATFQATAAAVTPALAGATVNGINLVDGSQAAAVKASLGDGATVSLTPLDLTLGGPTVTLSASASVATATAAAASFASLGDAIGATSDALSTLRGQADQLYAHGGVLQALGGALALPQDDGGDSARLLALQVGQQLSGTTPSIANTAPQSILSLFRS